MAAMLLAGLSKQGAQTLERQAGRPGHLGRGRTAEVAARNFFILQ